MILLLLFLNENNNFFLFFQWVTIIIVQNDKTSNVWNREKKIRQRGQDQGTRVVSLY